MTDKIKWNEHLGCLLDSVKGFNVIECEYCGFKHIVPIPTAGELERVYREDYYAKEKPLYIEHNREDREWWDLVYGERYEILEELLLPQRRRILDVGSGPGLFLYHGKQRGWKTLGVEPSIQAANHARKLGVEVIEGFLNEHTAKKLGHFDVVHMSKVLEHIPDPKAMIMLTRDLLLPDGLLLIDVPNDYNPFQQALRTVCHYKPWWVAPPHHINYFDFASLARLLEHCGLAVIHKEASFPIDIFLLMGDNYVGNEALGRICHGRRKSFELNLAKAGMGTIKNKLYQYLADLGLGRDVVLCGQKKVQSGLT